MNKEENTNNKSDFYNREVDIKKDQSKNKLSGWVCPRCYRVNSPYKLECDC